MNTDNTKAAHQDSETAIIDLNSSRTPMQCKGTENLGDSQEEKRKIAMRCIDMMAGCNALTFRILKPELDGMGWYADTPAGTELLSGHEFIEWKASDANHGFLFVPLTRPVSDGEANMMAKAMRTRGVKVQERECADVFLPWLMERDYRVGSGEAMEPPERDEVPPALEEILPLGDIQPEVSFDSDRQPVNVPLASGEETHYPPDSIPIWGLPESLQRIVEEICSSIGSPRDFGVACMFSAAGTALGNRVEAYFGSFHNRPNTWFALVGDSGIANKTQTISAFYDPIRTVDKEETNEYNKQVYNWKLRQAALSSKKSKGKGLQPDEVDDSQSQRPRNNTRIMDDTTDDKITRRLCESDAVTWDVDELASVFGTMGRHTKNGSIKVAEKNLMKGFDGTRLKQERVSEDFVLQSQNPCLSIIGGIQPDTLINQLKGVDFTQDGLLQRFVMIYPDITYPDEYTAPKSAIRAKTEWKHIVRDLMCIDRVTLHETSEAYKTHCDVLTEWLRLQRDSYSDFSPMRSLIQKMGYYLCRLSIIVAMLNGKANINEDAVRYSAECCDVFIRYGERVLRLVTEPQRPRKATRKEAILALNEVAPITNKTMFAKSIGVSKQYISKIFSGKG